MIRIWSIVAMVWLAPLPAAAVEMPGPEMRAELVRLRPVQGPTITAADLEDRVVVVTFFASWCPPCRKEFPHLNRVQRVYRDAGLQVVGVNVFETFDGLSSPAKLERFLAEMRPDFPILRGDRALREAFFDLDRIPSLFVFARDGRLAMVFRHQRDSTETHLSEAELRTAIEPLL